jgi:beta-barrel assembly-enhancing protease
MRARYFDGLTAAAHEVEVALGPEALSFGLEGERHVWPFAALEPETVGDQVRIGRRGDPARLVLPAAEWQAMLAAAGPASHRHLRGRELRLVGGLTAAAGAIAAFVFIGVPAASGPLARLTPPAYEQRMGENFEAQLGLAFRRCRGEPGQKALQRLAHVLETRSDSPFQFRVQAVEAPMVNAFALPGGAILVTDDLIEAAESPDELAAVIAHEAAHVEKRHVMQAVWRSLGLGLVLDAVVGGGTGAGQQAVLLAGSFTDLRYSRDAETEADSRGQDLLQAAELSSLGMAPFFERIAVKGEGPNETAVRELISSHPDALRRAKLSRARARSGGSAFSAAEWKAIRTSCDRKDRRLPVPRIR